MHATASIALAEIDRDKSQEMLKAQDSADQIIGAVEGEVKNLLVNEGKDNIDDKVEENKEKADEAEKKQEEQQEKIDEKRKERKRTGREIIEGQAEADKLEMNANIRSNDVDHVTEAQKQIVRIMKDNKMLNEDIKGIDIDLNF